MKKISMILIVSIIGLSIACKGGANKGVAEAKETMNKLTDLTEKFTKDIQEAKDAKVAVSLINNYAKDVKPVYESMKAIPKKYPELVGQKEPPAELKDATERFTKAMVAQGGALSEVVVKYQGEAEVKKALDEIKAIFTQQ